MTAAVVDHLLAESQAAALAAKDAEWREDWGARDAYHRAATALVDVAVEMLEGTR